LATATLELLDIEYLSKSVLEKGNGLAKNTIFYINYALRMIRAVDLS
jgi:hypothetical protein